MTTSLHAMREMLLHTDDVGLYPVSRLEYLQRISGLVRLDTGFELPSTNCGIVQPWGGTRRVRTHKPPGAPIIDLIVDV